MKKQLWWHLTAFGDNTVLLPLALLIVLWLLIVPTMRRTGWIWLAVVLANIGVVIASKVLYMAWELHPPGLDFIGLSGHCAMAFLFWPSVGALAAGYARPGWRGWAVAAGVLLAVAIAVSRLVLHAHSPSEIVLGSVWGALLAGVFLWLTQRPAQQRAAAGWIVLIVLLPPLLMTHRLSFPSNRVLIWAAMRASGHRFIYTRCNLAPDTRACQAGDVFEYSGDDSNSGGR